MDVNEVIDAYVRDVAFHLPRARRNDVALELRALLHEELAARADAAGGRPDRAMAMALLAEFGHPAEAAQRYHPQPALIEPAHTRLLLIWVLGGTVVLGMHAAVTDGPIDAGALFLQWLGALLLCFAVLGWWRRRPSERFGWTPGHGPEWMPRSLSAFALACLLAFPVFMYAAPLDFARLLLPAAVPVDGLALAPEFAGSRLRLSTMVLLVALALQYGMALALGSRPTWLRRIEVAITLALGMLFVAHGSIPASPRTGTGLQVFHSAAANAVSGPIFVSVGAMMVLFGLYYTWRELSLTDPAPARQGRAMRLRRDRR